MKSTVIRKGATASIILGFGALLSACGGGGGGSSNSTNNTITGYTTDGPFSASIYVYNTSGSLCGEAVSSSQDGSFTVSLSSSCSSGPYLIKAIATSGLDADTYYYIANQTLHGIYITPISDALIRREAAKLGYEYRLVAFEKNPNTFANIEQQELNQPNSSNLSFTSVFFPYSETITGTITTQSSVSNISYTIGGIDKLVYPLNYTNGTILVKHLSYGDGIIENGQNTNSYTHVSYGTFASLFSITSDVLSLTRPYETESVSFSGNFSNPSSLSILSLSSSINNGSESGYKIITNGSGTANGIENGATYSFTITTTNPIAVATTCNINNNTLTCGNSTSIQVTRSITYITVNGIQDPEVQITVSGKIGGVNISPITYLRR